MLTENKKYLSKSALFLLLTAGVIALIFMFGIRAAIEISLFLQKRNSPPLSSAPYENVVPPPELFPIAEATNSSSLPLSGYSLPNQKVDVYINDLNIKTLDANSEGKFEGDISLSLGLSKIYAVSVNSLGVKSSPSKSWTIFYNDSPPYLEILEPNNNSTIKGRQNTITFKGKIANTSRIFINDHQVITENSGNFTYPVTLVQGENKFKIVCLDPAQNKTELEWQITYQP